MRKSELKNLAAGLCTSFISRNNSISRYWALGKIYQFAKESHVEFVEFDLVKLTVTPHAEDFGIILHQYALWLKSNAAKNSKENDIQSATIKVEFNTSQPNTGVVYRQTYGDLFLVLVTVSDSREKEATAKIYGYCAPTDPTRESRTTRSD
ncbi:hypothetical protein [Undibacterium sp.]|uniref:hypothetical protein n=1 Tax=Undibacterium sp. TaxID=1914977 RepID=UPI003751171D